MVDVIFCHKDRKWKPQNGKCANFKRDCYKLKMADCCMCCEFTINPEYIPKGN